MRPGCEVLVLDGPFANTRALLCSLTSDGRARVRLWAYGHQVTLQVWISDLAVLH